MEDIAEGKRLLLSAEVDYTKCMKYINPYIDSGIKSEEEFSKTQRMGFYFPFTIDVSGKVIPGDQAKYESKGSEEYVDLEFDIGQLEKGEVSGTFSKEEYVSNWDNPLARCWSINEGWEEKRRHPRNYPDTQPVFRAILKSEFEKVGGFTPGGYTDDWSLSPKLGYEAKNAPGAKFYHKNPDNLSEIFEQSKWVGKRRYKLGALGYVVAFLRASLPVSLVVGLVKTVINLEPSFIVFKVVYDFGIFVGILEFLFFKKESK